MAVSQGQQPSLYMQPPRLKSCFVASCRKGGLIFGIINIIGNFGTVFCDQAYWVSHCFSFQ